MISIGKNTILNPLEIWAYHKIFDIRKGHANTHTCFVNNSLMYVNNANINPNRQLYVEKKCCNEEKYNL